MSRKAITVTMLTLALLGGGVLGTAVLTHADTVPATSTVPSKPKFMSNLVSAIAQKFNLDESQVQAVFDEQITKDRAEMETRMKEEFATRLKNAVSEGTLTQTQADLITAKKAELDAKFEAQKTSGTKPTKEEIDAQMQELKTWAEQNNIPKEFMMFRFAHGGRGGHFKDFSLKQPTQ